MFLWAMFEERLICMWGLAGSSICIGSRQIVPKRGWWNWWSILGSIAFFRLLDFLGEFFEFESVPVVVVAELSEDWGLESSCMLASGFCEPVSSVFTFVAAESPSVAQQFSFCFLSCLTSEVCIVCNVEEIKVKLLHKPLWCEYSRVSHLLATPRRTISQLLHAISDSWHFSNDQVTTDVQGCTVFKST